MQSQGKQQIPQLSGRKTGSMEVLKVLSFSSETGSDGLRVGDPNLGEPFPSASQHLSSPRGFNFSSLLSHPGLVPTPPHLQHVLFLNNVGRSLGGKSLNPNGKDT